MRKWFILVIALHEIAAAPQLVKVITLFRHGDRYPEHSFTHNDDEKTINFFKKGQLTEDGTKNSKKLGTELKERYVDNGFLPPTDSLDKDTIEFVSVEVARCQNSAREVFKGMFSVNKSDDLKITTTPRKKDYMLYTPRENCPQLDHAKRRRCTTMKPFNYYKTHFDYEYAMYECSGATKKASYFTKKEECKNIEAIATAFASGLPMPEWVTEDVRKEAEYLFEEKLAWSHGVFPYSDKFTVKTNVGELMNYVMSRIENGTDPVKFVAISTQDWIIESFMEALGAKRNTLGRKSPMFTSCIAIERWREDDEEYVKVLYRRGSVENEFVNITPHVSNCPLLGRTCPLDRFQQCCTFYRHESGAENCQLLLE